jgi:hypothetical protein
MNPMKRRCGDCQLCCRLLPTTEINKPALARCPNQRHGKGCAIYDKRPVSCALWNCRWLVDESTQDLPRPDRSHYVIDMIPDFITYTEDGQPPQHMEVIQVWVDPAYRDAHRAPSFRRWLDEHRVAAVIRYSSTDGFVLFPASMTGGHGFIEHKSTAMAEHSHTLEEKAAALGGTLEVEVEHGGMTTAYRTILKVGDRALPIGTLAASDEDADRALANAQKIAGERAAQIERRKEQP